MNTTVTIFFLDGLNGLRLDACNLYEDKYLRVVEKYLPKTYLQYGKVYDDKFIVTNILALRPYGLYQERFLTRKGYYELREQTRYVEIQLEC